MKRSLRAVVILGLGFGLGVLTGCDSSQGPGQGPGPGQQPAPVSGPIALTAQEKAFIAETDGQPITDLLTAIAKLAAGRPGVGKDVLIQALDSSFELRCHENCEVKGR